MPSTNLGAEPDASPVEQRRGHLSYSARRGLEPKAGREEAHPTPSHYGQAQFTTLVCFGKKPWGAQHTLGRGF